MPRPSLASVAFSFAAFTLLGGCGASSSSPTADSGPPPVDQCDNPDDLTIVENLALAIDGGLPDADVPDGGPYPLAYWSALAPVLQECAQQACLAEILNESGADACMTECLASTDAAGLSAGCIGCQYELVRCVSANCINNCLGGDQAACEACSYGICGPRLAECTGLTIPIP